MKLKKTSIFTFTDRVYAIVAKIPKGSTRTYKEVAILAGSPRAYRAVGGILAKNTDPKHIPCHRVIRTDGSVGGYFGSMRRRSEKKKKLVREGAL